MYEFIYQIYQIYQNIHNTDIVYIPIFSFPVFPILFLSFPKHFLMIFCLLGYFFPVSFMLLFSCNYFYKILLCTFLSFIQILKTLIQNLSLHLQGPLFKNCYFSLLFATLFVFINSDFTSLSYLLIEAKGDLKFSNLFLPLLLWV